MTLDRRSETPLPIKKGRVTVRIAYARTDQPPFGPGEPGEGMPPSSKAAISNPLEQVLSLSNGRRGWWNGIHSSLASCRLSRGLRVRIPSRARLCSTR